MRTKQKTQAGTWCFTLRLTGTGPTRDAAWLDAVEVFTTDPGSTPDPVPADEPIKDIIITVEGGVIQNILKPNCAKHIPVLVQDYDTDGCDGPNLKTQPDGTQCFETTW